MTQKQREILVTSALPYANGALHIGHLFEYLLSDIWVRHQRMNKHRVFYVCADDAHGTPIMIHARKEGLNPEALIGAIGAEFRRLFDAFHISFDNYHTTHSSENRQLCNRFFAQFKEAGFIEERTIEQLYDAEQDLFLPDRFVKGTCPECKAKDQNGDSCDHCGSTYDSTRLIDPVSVLSGKRPQARKSKHLFFLLSKAQGMLEHWLDEVSIVPKSRNKVKEWLKEGLRDWDISRDAPYFGFEIEGHLGQYFYVWVDAPIGYLASFKKYCDEKGLDFESFLREDSQAEMVHFIGKDILYFHTLFWPAMLHAAGLRKPSAVYAHGFVTDQGEKMSKSKGALIKLATYLETLPSEYLRYYLAHRASGSIEDISWSAEDFKMRINSELVGKLANISSRCASLIKRTGGVLDDVLHDQKLYQEFLEAQDAIIGAYEERHYAKVCQSVSKLCDKVNAYLNETKPWTLVKDEPQRARAIATMGVNLFRMLVIFLQPILPQLAEKTRAWLKEKEDSYSWDDLNQRKLGVELPELSQHFYTRIEDKHLALLAQDESSDTDQSAQSEDAYVTIEDFTKVKLKVATIIEAKEVPKSDKLLQFKVRIGGQQRQIFAGIKGHYKPSDLIGRKVIVVANLKPRQMRFGTSEGMMLAASGNNEVFLLHPDEGAQDGQDVS